MSVSIRFTAASTDPADVEAALENALEEVRSGPVDRVYVVIPCCRDADDVVELVRTGKGVVARIEVHTTGRVEPQALVKRYGVTIRDVRVKRKDGMYVVIGFTEVPGTSTEAAVEYLINAIDALRDLG